MIDTKQTFYVERRTRFMLRPRNSVIKIWQKGWGSSKVLEQGPTNIINLIQFQKFFANQKC